MLLDIKGAYNQVNRGILWWQCRRRELSGTWLGLLQLLFNECEGVVGVGGYASACFSPEVGMLQGSVLSLLLFAVFIDDLAKEMQCVISGLLVNRIWMNVFLFMDNLALVVDNLVAMQVALQIAEEHAIWNQYLWSVSKSIILGTG